MTLVRRELEKQTGSTARSLVVGRAHLDLAVGDDEPGTFMDLMLSQLLAGAKAQQDRAALAGRREDLRLLRLTSTVLRSH